MKSTATTVGVTEEARKYLEQLVRFKYKTSFVSYLIIAFCEKNPNKFDQLVNNKLSGMSVERIKKFLEGCD